LAAAHPSTGFIRLSKLCGARRRCHRGVVDRGRDIVETGADIVNEHAVQPTVDFLSDPENVLSVAQTGSGIVAQVACKGGGVVCAAALTVYVTASIGKVGLALIDSRCERWVALGTAALGAPV